MSKQFFFVLLRFLLIFLLNCQFSLPKIKKKGAPNRTKKTNWAEKNNKK